MKIESFEIACKKRKYDPKKVLPDVSAMPKKHQKAIVATAMLMIIVEASRSGKVPDWNDTNERKWYPWFYLNKPGFRFDDTLYVITYTYSTGGSRLVYLSEEDAEFHAKKFIDLYKDMMVISK